jgi:cobalt/nickel transport system permease protein
VEHHYLDEHASIDSPVHRLEARTKLVALLTLVVCTALTPPTALWAFGVYLLLLAVLLGLSRLPLAAVLRRALWFGPFILTAVLLVPFVQRGDGAVAAELAVGGLRLRLYSTGLLVARGILLKSGVSALSVILLVSTTHFSQLLKGMERLGLPRLLLAIISFLYRYLFLLLDQFMRLLRAARSRNLEAGPLSLRLRAAGGIVGSLFIRTYSRAERVHAAMLARGYQGTLPLLRDTRLGAADFAFLGVFLPAVIGVCAAALLGFPEA